jgi:hypothetical protein
MTTPKVFISYSHDYEEHKAWVADLARFLVSNGIDGNAGKWGMVGRYSISSRETRGA